MTDADRFKLRFGPYRIPKCKVGKLLRCVIRGDKKVVGISDAPIPWPMTQHDSRKGCGRPYLIVCGDLVKAIKRESATAVAHWWGVGKNVVWQWRKALGVEAITEGTRARFREAIVDGREMHGEAYREAISSPEWVAKHAGLAESKRGKQPPAHVKESLQRANEERRVAKEKRLREARKGKPPRPAAAPWTSQEDHLVRTFPPAEVAAKTGRTRDAVYDRRRVLGAVTVGRGVRWTPEEDALLRRHSVDEVMAATGRSKTAVELRRWSLGIEAKR